MDTSGMLMYAELIGPVIASRRKAGAKCSILVMDNCPSHVRPAVVAEFAKHGVVIKFLPKNSTDFLQVCCCWIFMILHICMLGCAECVC